MHDLPTNQRTDRQICEDEEERNYKMNKDPKIELKEQIFQSTRFFFISLTKYIKTEKISV